MARRLKQVLDRLLAGDSEKRIALALGISRHTVHIYVKALYRAHGANSRGELLAQYIVRGATIPARPAALPTSECFSPGC